jgi:hypothetical protein
MPAVNDVGEPCAGEPHARFDGRVLETEHPGQGHRSGTTGRETAGTKAAGPTPRYMSPRQRPTLHSRRWPERAAGMEVPFDLERWVLRRILSFEVKGTCSVKRTGSRSKIVVTADGRGVVGHAGAQLLRTWPTRLA